MARYFHGGMDRREDKGVGGVVGGGIDKGQNPDHPTMLVRPPLHGGGTVPLKKGGVTLSLAGAGWWHIGPGEYVDLPESVAVKAVKNACPQLLTKGEAVEAGLCNDDGSPVRVKAEVKAPEVKSQPSAPSK